MMIASNIIQAVNTCFYLYYILIIVRCLLTWIPNINWENPIFMGLKSAVDPYLNWFRIIIPPIGMFDFSPILALFALVPFNWIVIQILVVIFRALGMLGQ